MTEATRHEITANVRKIRELIGAPPQVDGTQAASTQAQGVAALDLVQTALIDLNRIADAITFLANHAAATALKLSPDASADKG
jgi:hypothetical protein